MSAPGHASHQPKVGHLVSWKTLVATALALMFLTWVTVEVRTIPLGDWNIWLALLIAVIKATLVCMFFMHLKWDRPFNALVLVGSLLFLALFLGFSIVDTGHYQQEINWESATFYTQSTP